MSVGESAGPKLRRPEGRGPGMPQGTRRPPHSSAGISRTRNSRVLLEGESSRAEFWLRRTIQSKMSRLLLLRNCSFSLSVCMALGVLQRSVHYSLLVTYAGVPTARRGQTEPTRAGCEPSDRSPCSLGTSPLPGTRHSGSSCPFSATALKPPFL